MNGSTLVLTEHQARCLLLAEAVETTDVRGELLSDSERDQIDTQAAAATNPAAAAGKHGEVGAILLLRSQLVLKALESRASALVALQRPSSWQRALSWFVPLLALCMGIATDLVANPRRVDLLSLPLLGVVLWNLVVYAAVLLAAMRPATAPHTPLIAALGRWFDGWVPWRRFGAAVRARCAAAFFKTWYPLCARLDSLRLQAIFHFAAAAWGAGVAVSLLLRGLVVQYRAGWESTFLDAEQVYALLNILFMPVVALFSLAPFTLQDIAAMRFDSGTQGAVEQGRRWAWLCAGLLMVLVVLPRMSLAALAWWRVQRASQQLSVNMGSPYFQRLLDRLIPAQVRFCLLVQNTPSQTALQRMLALTGPPGEQLLLDTPHGDTLQMAAFRGLAPTPVVPNVWQRWLAQLDRRIARWPEPRDHNVDAVLQVVTSPEDLQRMLPRLQPVGVPVLVLVDAGSVAQTDALLEQGRAHARHHDCIAAVLPLDNCCRCWAQDHRWLDALARCVPRSKAQGFERLRRSWEARNLQRLRTSMEVLADALLAAAREQRAVPDAPLSIKLLRSKERITRDQAILAAQSDIASRLTQFHAGVLARLLALHALDASAAASLQHALEESFAVRSTIDAPQAGMAGASAGALAGGSVDLVTGGLTLGVASLLGAVVGGGVAYAGTAWKNRALTSGVTQVELGEEMLQPLVEVSLLRYLAVIHYDREPRGAGPVVAPPSWKNEVAAATKAQREPLQILWAAARLAEPQVQTATLARELETIAHIVLRKLYPDARIQAA